MADLKTDKISWILSLDASKAEESIHILYNDNEKLKDSNKEINKEIKNLSLNYEKNKKRIEELNKARNENNKKLKENREQIKMLSEQMGLENLSMKQLQNRARDLRNQMNGLSRSLNPEEWKRLRGELEATEKRMDKLKGGGNGLMKMLNVKKSGIIASLVVLGAKLTENVKEFTAKSIKMAAEADGVIRAFKALNSPGLLENLRSATKGTVNDLELMKAAVQAKNFRLPLEDLGKYLMFAQKKAQDTGQSVDYMVNSIITGLGRQSVKILDNLGLSAAEINEEVAKTGDFIKGVANIIDKDLAESGGKYVSAADRAAKSTVVLENAMLKLGQKLQFITDWWINLKTNFLTGLSSLFDTTSDRFFNLKEKLVDMEMTIPSLLNRYDELKEKTKLSADEQKELASIISTVSGAIPGAASEFDSYGNAISLSTDKVYEFLESQKSLLQYQNKDAIKQVTKDLENYRKTYAVLIQEQKQGGRIKSVKGAMGWSGASTSYVDKSTLKDVEEDLKKTGDLIRGAEEQLAQLNGESLEEAIENRKKRNEAMAKFTSMNKKQLTQWIADEKNAKDEYLQLAKDILRSKSEAVDKNASENELKTMEAAHQTQLNEIRLNGYEKQKTEEEINADLLASERDYLNARIVQLGRFIDQEMDQSKKADFRKQLVQSQTELLKLQDTQDKGYFASAAKNRKKAIDDNRILYNASLMSLKQALTDRTLSQEQYDAQLLALQQANAGNVLRIEQQYQADVVATTVKNGNLKVEAVEDANRRVLEAEQNLSTATMALQVKMNDLVKDFKNQFKLTTVDEDLAAQMKVLEDAYNARKQMAVDAGILDTGELDESYLRAKEQLEEEYQQRINAVRQKYGLTDQQEQYDLELVQLRAALDQKLLTQQEYEDAVKNLKRDSYKQQIDYYNGLFSSAFDALQQAELDKVNSKYDAMISAAESNGEDTTKLEEKKEAEKLKVQKKYADVNFAIKASQIIADTSVAIMKANAELGPIAGAVSAALLSITGAAQLASANAERERVKNLTAGGSSGTGSSGSGKRVATGLEKGGPLSVIRKQDGKNFEDVEYDPHRRGYVDRPTVIVGEGPSGQSREFVASNAAVNNPTIAPILNIIDQSQRAGTIRTLDLNQVIRREMAGFSSGGFVDRKVTENTAAVRPSSDGSSDVIGELTRVLKSIQEEGIPASVVLTELERKQQMRDKARKIGKKI